MCLFVSFYVSVPFSMKRFTFLEEFSKMSRRFHVFKKTAWRFCLILNKSELSWQIKIEVSYTKFQKKICRVPCSSTRADGQILKSYTIIVR